MSAAANTLGGKVTSKIIKDTTVVGQVVDLISKIPARAGGMAAEKAYEGPGKMFIQFNQPSRSKPGGGGGGTRAYAQ